MILIGVVTYKRAAFTVPAFCDKLRAHPPSEGYGGLALACDGEKAMNSIQGVGDWADWRVFGGKERVGVAGNKNRILSYFWKHTDFRHLFLFEDDCWPIRDGWDEFYLQHHEAGQTECLLFLPERMYGAPSWSRILPEGRALLGYEKDGGMLLSLTRKAVTTCGGFHRAFQRARYGGEHSEYVRRLTRNGLMPWTYLAPRGCESYLDGWDVANWRGDLRKQPGYCEWVHELATSPDVHKLPPGQTKREAEQGLAIYDRVKDDGSVFHDPRWE